MIYLSMLGAKNLKLVTSGNVTLKGNREYAFITKSTNNRKIRFQVSGKKNSLLPLVIFVLKIVP